MREVTVDKTKKKMGSMSNGKIKQGRQIGLCVYMRVCVCGCWGVCTLGVRHIFKSGQEKNGFLFSTFSLPSQM